MAYEDVGRGDRPLILVHGFHGFRQDFRDHMTTLAEIGRTIAYDLRGHGESTKTKDAASYSFDQLVRDLLGLLDAVGVEKCDLLGHSMGGMVALRFVLAHPERVASLVLMDTSARVPDGLELAPISVAAAIARAEGMEKLATLLQQHAMGDPTRAAASRRLEERMGTEAYWERHHKRVGGMDPEAFATLGVMLADQVPLTDRLAEIDCPTLVMVGEEDTPFLASARELVNGIGGARAVEIAASAHNPQLENPAAWITAIRDHLERVR